MKKAYDKIIRYENLSLEQRLQLLRFIQKRISYMSMHTFCKQKPGAALKGEYLVGIAEEL